jgi:phosphoribosylformylglycinamidine synthase II
MTFKYRIEIYPNENNISIVSHESEISQRWAKKYLDLNLTQVWEIRYFLIESEKEINDINAIAQDVFSDSVIENTLTNNSRDFDQYLDWLKLKHFNSPWLIDVGFRPGVTDNSAHAACDALKIIPQLKDHDFIVSSGKMIFVEGDGLNREILLNLTYEYYANMLLHKCQVLDYSELKNSNRFKNIMLPKVVSETKKIVSVDINQNFEDLKKLNLENCWVLSDIELLQVKKYFNYLKRNPTDVEMEIIAQTWSEHCKHKIFSAEINYQEHQLPKGVKSLGQLNVNGLFKTYIRGATNKIKSDRKLPWLISLFHDNAGIVRFDEVLDICIKVETHNSPSALDPYGGALTGILGVNRDIYGVGVGAKPIANTNVFCLAENKYFKDNNIALPLMIKNPDRIKEGVHLGVQDGGNKSGIPTVNGAFVFDRDFVGKPLVFCGTIGVIPQIENQKETSLKGQCPGDLIVMAGGRIGKDGIHGATFSSMELVDGVPATVVQIGDPITQKRLGEFLLEARLKNLFTSVTDNGAGGLSSSVGEMAQTTNGADVYLDKALVKYPGLSPYELMISESQERMTFSVSKEKIDDFLKLAKMRSVEASVIGEFNNSGLFKVFFKNELVSELALNFLFESLKPMELNAIYDQKLESKHWIGEKKNNKFLKDCDLKTILFNLMSSSNIKSQEHLIRRYDHEVKGATIMKPFTGHDDIGYMGPSDAGIIWMKPHGGGHNNAIAIASGICPKWSKYDTYAMAENALDEAVRNAVSSGANPDEMVLIDNFCWPDPVESLKNPDGAYKCAQLVRTNQALFDLSTSYGMPFVSGKDSMKNDFVGKIKSGETVKISVPPTLLITAVGRIPQLKIITTTEIKNTDSLIYLLGDECIDYKSAFELSLLFDDYKVEHPLPTLNAKKQLDLYRSLHKSMREGLVESSHDLSDGGLLVTLVEKMMSTPFGIDVDCTFLEKVKMKDYFFNEAPGRLVVSINLSHQKEFEENMTGHSFMKIGKTTSQNKLRIIYNQEIFADIDGEDCLNHYRVDSVEVSDEKIRN